MFCARARPAILEVLDGSGDAGRASARCRRPVGDLMTPRFIHVPKKQSGTLCLLPLEEAVAGHFLGHR